MSKPLLFYPDIPRRCNKIWHALNALGVGYHNDPDQPYEWGFLWHYGTRLEKGELERPLPTGLINHGGYDVSKRRVGVLHKQVFGYTWILFGTTGLSPTTRVLLKSNQQCAHVGEIMYYSQAARYHSSREPGEDRVISKLLDNRISPTALQDIRIAYFDGNMPFAWTKTRPAKELMGSSSSKDTLELYHPESLFSSRELQQISEFAGVFGVELAEFDILRNASDGLIYIIDVNNVAGTLGGTFRGLNPKQNRRKKDELMQRWTEAFAVAFL